MNSTRAKAERTTLTQARVRDIPLPETGRRIVYDNKVSEFGVRITPNGVRSLIVRKKVNGRAQILTLGRFPSLSVEQARMIASERLGEIAGGQDPAAMKRASRGEMTLGELWRDYFEHHAKAKKRSWKSDETRWNLNLKPWSNRRISTITAAEVAKLHSRVGRTSGKIAANRLISLVSKMFNLATKWGADAENPTRGIDRFEEHPRHRYLSGDELKRLGEALYKSEAEGSESPVVVAALRLLLLTGARYSEILGLRWAWIDSKAGRIQLPDSKTGFKVIHLNTAAQEVLNTLPVGGKWVLPGARKEQHLVNLQKPWGRIRRTAGLEDVRIHDLRHSFASFAVAGGLSLYVTGALLGHSQPQTTARYAHLDGDPLKKAAEIVGRQISDAWKQKEEESVGDSEHADKQD